jgi:hypothetical protein
MNIQHSIFDLTYCQMVRDAYRYACIFAVSEDARLSEYPWPLTQKAHDPWKTRNLRFPKCRLVPVRQRQLILSHSQPRSRKRTRDLGIRR